MKGRPRLSDHKKKKKMVPVYFPLDVYNDLVELAEIDGASRSDYIRRIVMSYVYSDESLGGVEMTEVTWGQITGPLEGTIIDNLEFEAYLSVDRPSKSTVVALVYNGDNLYCQAPDQTESMRKGSLVDLMLQNPDKFWHEHVVCENFKVNTILGKAEFNEWCRIYGTGEYDEDLNFKGGSRGKAVEYFQERFSKNLLFRKDADELTKIWGNIMRHEHATAWIQDAKPQQAVFGMLHGIPVKGLPDFIHNKYDLIVDVKRFKNAHPSSYMWKPPHDIESARPHIIASRLYGQRSEWASRVAEAAFYKDLVEEVEGRKRDFGFLVVDQKAPFGVYTYVVSEKSIKVGRYLYARALHQRDDFVNHNLDHSHHSDVHYI